MRLMIAMLSFGSGEHWLQWMPFFKNFVHDSLAKTVQSTFFGKASVRPASAFYHPQMHEFILMYDDVRQSASPKTTLLDFLQSTYEAGANSAKWNRAELERAA